MSYATWHIYGYGICVSDIEVESVEQIQALLNMAPEYEKKVRQWLEEENICQRRTEKIPKRRPGNDPNARIATPVFHAGTPSAGYISAGMSIGGTVWTPALSRSRRR